MDEAGGEEEEEEAMAMTAIPHQDACHVTLMVLTPMQTPTTDVATCPCHLTTGTHHTLTPTSVAVWLWPGTPTSWRGSGTTTNRWQPEMPTTTTMPEEGILC